MKSQQLKLEDMHRVFEYHQDKAQNKIKRYFACPASKADQPE